MEIVKKGKHIYKKIITKYIFILIGTIMIAIGSGLFLIPTSVNAGGLSGLGIIIQKTTGFDPDLTVLIASWILFLIGLPILGWKFTFKSLLSTIVYPLALMVFIRVPFFQNFAKNTFLNELGEPKDTATLLIAALFGGAFTGLGVGLTFVGGGSTGGVDILVCVINKYTRVKHSISSFLIDALIIVIGIFVAQNTLVSLIGIVAAFMCALLIEYVFVGGTSTLTAQIISTNHVDEINNYIHNVMERGSTFINVEGGYKGDPKKMIVVSFTKNEYQEMIEAISKIDPKAFVIVSHTQEVMGEGFRELKTNKRKRNKKSNDK